MRKPHLHGLLPLVLAAAAAGAQASLVVDPFETGLPFGTDANRIPLGFFTFAGASGSASIATTAAPPAPVPGAAVGNQVLNTGFAASGSAAAGGFAGVARFFSNPGVDTWVSQDWSAYNALRFWMYGQGTGTELFIDIIDNRNPGSTTEDAGRYVTTLFDDFSGWRQVTLSFADFVRKDIGNGAPDDGLTLTEMHGWAIGSYATPGGAVVSWFFDDVAVVTVPEPSSLLLLAAGTAALWRSRRRAGAAA